MKGFDTEKDLETFMEFANSTVNNTKNYLGGIVFTNSFKDNGTVLPRKVSYKIRLTYSPRNAGNQKSYLNPYKGDTNWKTDFMFPLFQRIGPREKGAVCGGNPGTEISDLTFAQ